MSKGQKKEQRQDISPETRAQLHAPLPPNVQVEVEAALERDAKKLELDTLHEEMEQQSEGRTNPSVIDDGYNGDRRQPRTAYDNQRKAIVALSHLCSAKVGHRIEPALQEVITYMTEGIVDAAIKQRLEIIAAVSGCDRVKQAVEALA